jgi:hypothetical protein
MLLLGLLSKLTGTVQASKVQQLAAGRSPESSVEKQFVASHYPAGGGNQVIRTTIYRIAV